jgi:hypothetical protein
MADPIKFPGEFFTPEDRERDRWVSVAFMAAAMPLEPESRLMFLKELLRKFADVPHSRITDRQFWPQAAREQNGISSDARRYGERRGNVMTDLFRDMPEIQAQMKDIFGRPDSREIVKAAFSIARRGYSGPQDSLLMASSDDTRGCLLFRAAMRGDIDAMALLAKVPSLRVRVATSDEMATIASGKVVTREGRP